MKYVLRRLIGVVPAMLVAMLASQAHAHFLWLKSDAAAGKPQAVLLFGESPLDEAYHLPASLNDTEIFVRTADGKREQLKTEKVDNDDRVGLVAPLTATSGPEVLEATRQYGVYGDFLLTYFAKHILAENNGELAAAGPSPSLALDILPAATAEGLEITVLWNGKPRPDATVNIAIGEDDEPTKLTTDAAGKVTYQPKTSGLVGVLANISDETQSGELKGKKYSSAAYYSSLTFPWQAAANAASASDAKKSSATVNKSAKKVASNSGLPALPKAISSFGAAVSDGYLYVYGGHTGTEHDHSAANLSQHFVRAPLAGATAWEELPMQLPLQGLALVAHGGKLYRVGGLNARNATTDDEEDLHSTAEFSAFDPATKSWSPLAPLPAPRSSHNAVVIGDKLYVTGGWTLTGSRDGEWLEDSLVYEFANPNAGWQKLPKQDFQRRALAAGQWKGQLVALGGMDEAAEISREVNLFDPAIGKWTKGPKLPGSGMSGFGVSAWALGDNLYVSGSSGRVYKLADDGASWQEVAKLAQKRFFHQLVPAAKDHALLVVGGASFDGHLDDIEMVEVGESAAKANEPDAKSPASPPANQAAEAKI